MPQVILTSHLEEALVSAIDGCAAEQIFLLADTTTARLCLPRLRPFTCLAAAQEIVIPAGEEHKTLASCTVIWEGLHAAHASRRALLINVGGGMITDIGGFCAATYKRGIAFINIPTTLLGMVDAAVGGKTGINFLDVKNEIGAFRAAESVIIDPSFLATLDVAPFLSGFAEMLKHGLLSDEASLAALLNYDLAHRDITALRTMIELSLAVKQRLVARDPMEQGPRMALNIGHTIGHALEALSLHRGTPLLHGYAIAFGLVAELYLSTVKKKFPVATLRQVATFIRSNYGSVPLLCDDYDTLFTLMQHDKKNRGGNILFSLLHDVGNVELHCRATQEEIYAALDFLREG